MIKALPLTITNSMLGLSMWNTRVANVHNPESEYKGSCYSFKASTTIPSMVGLFLNWDISGTRETK